MSIPAVKINRKAQSIGDQATKLAVDQLESALLEMSRTVAALTERINKATAFPI